VIGLVLAQFRGGLMPVLEQQLFGQFQFSLVFHIFLGVAIAQQQIWFAKIRRTVTTGA
jgi:hypothetical protein